MNPAPQRIAPPPQAQCRTVLADGGLACITATRRPRDGRSDVKCAVLGSPHVAERMQAVVRAARLTEAVHDTRDQVVLSIDRAPAAQERDWELAAVLADRMVRGIAPLREVCANGWSERWHLGQVMGHDRAADGALLGGTELPHLGALTGHADPAASVSTARAWFPLVSGGAEDRLAWVEVSVFPRDGGAGDEEDTITAPHVDAAQLAAVRAVLAGARDFDGHAIGRWRTVVRFEQPRFQGNSYELALVMADRLARGREFPARGRVIASGCSTAWHAGRVDAVDGCTAKAALVLREACAGDRVLLPLDWKAQLGEGFAMDLRTRGASVACVDRIGII
ncbi:MAG: hypothetical protein ACXU8N_04595 [Telluria sp.]